MKKNKYIVPNGGYSKLYDQVVKKIGYGAPALNIYVYLLTNANFVSKEVYCGGKLIELKRGQCVFTYRELAKDLGLPLTTVSRNVKKLEGLGVIKVEAERNFTIATLLFYDGAEHFSETELGQKRNRCGTHAEHFPSKKIDLAGETDSLRMKERKNERKKKNKNIYITAKEIFNYWNEKKIIVHRDFEKFKPDIISALKHYSEKEIKEAIDNYATVLFSDDYFFSYRFTLYEFLTKGIDKFLSINNPLENFKKDEVKEGNWYEKIKEYARRSDEEERREAEEGKKMTEKEKFALTAEVQTAYSGGKEVIHELKKDIDFLSECQRESNLYSESEESVEATKKEISKGKDKKRSSSFEIKKCTHSGKYCSQCGEIRNTPFCRYWGRKEVKVF